MTRILEYDAGFHWLVATERVGDRESSTVVAKFVPLSVGLAIVAALEQARLVADRTVWVLPAAELDDELAELGRRLDAI